MGGECAREGEVEQVREPVMMRISAIGLRNLSVTMECLAPCLTLFTAGCLSVAGKLIAHVPINQPLPPHGWLVMSTVASFPTSSRHSHPPSWVRSPRHTARVSRRPFVETSPPSTAGLEDSAWRQTELVSPTIHSHGHNTSYKQGQDLRCIGIEISSQMSRGGYSAMYKCSNSTGRSCRIVPWAIQRRIDQQKLPFVNTTCFFPNTIPGAELKYQRLKRFQRCLRHYAATAVVGPAASSPSLAPAGPVAEASCSGAAGCSGSGSGMSFFPLAL